MKMKTRELRKLMKDTEFKARFRERLLANGLFDLSDAGYRDSQEAISMRYIAGVMRAYFQTLQRFNTKGKGGKARSILFWNIRP